MKYQIQKLIQYITPDSVFAILKNYKHAADRKKLKQTYAGSDVECVICEAKYRLFTPFGMEQRENAMCPNCGSLERHRLLWKYFHEKTGLFGNKKLRLLHFAPEEAFYYPFSEAENLEYYPVDLYPKLFAFKGKVKIKKADITKIPFEDNYFDVIICNHVLEHIPDDRLAMSEMFRVLKKGSGWGVFQVPIKYELEETYEDFSITDPAERVKAFGQHDHVRWYGQDYKERLTSVGFMVEEDDYIKSFSGEQVFKYGLMEGELIYKVTT